MNRHFIERPIRRRCYKRSKEPSRSKNLSTRDRLGLIRDVMAIAETGKVTTQSGLEFVKHYRSESEYVVWSEISSGLAKIRSLIADEPFVAEYDAFALSIFSEVAKKISWDTKPKDHAHALLKVLVLDALARYGDKKTIAHTQKLFASVTESRNAVPADLRGVVYMTVARSGAAAEHEEINSSLQHRHIARREEPYRARARRIQTKGIAAKDTGHFAVAARSPARLRTHDSGRDGESARANDRMEIHQTALEASGGALCRQQRAFVSA